MNKIILLSILICCSLIAQEGFEQEIAGTCRGGISFLVGDNFVSKYWDESYCYGGVVGWRIVPALSIRFSYDVYNYVFDDIEFSSQFEPIELIIGEWKSYGGQTNIFTIGGELKTIIPNYSVQPYILGGTGWMRHHTKKIDVCYETLTDIYYLTSIYEHTDNAFALYFGTGIDFHIVKSLILFIECRYIMGFMPKENIQIIPINFGLTLKGSN